ncbi:MAG: hypothetical protein KAQ87_04280 [Candidatus Pacebacteria bacterium]|nr:hypothetical protein [Candidatus Paceibacterota bacterium]
MNEEAEKNEGKWMNAIVKIIQYMNRSISDTEPDEDAIRDFLSEIKNGNPMQAFLKMPPIIWMTCETYDLQEEFSNLFIEAIKNDENFEKAIDFAVESVKNAILNSDDEDFSDQSNGEFLLECLKRVALQSLQNKS